MERTREVAVVGRGREMPARGSESLVTLPQRVAYGAWDGTKRFLEANSPEAWGNRILRVIGTKIVPKLTPDQKLWVLQHATGIEDAAMYMGAGITTAEIALAVVAAEKGIRKLFPTAPAAIETLARERRAASPAAQPQENLFGMIRDLVAKSETVPDIGIKEQLTAVAASLLVAGVDPTARDITLGLMSKKDRNRAFNRFERQFTDAFHSQMSTENGGRVPDAYVRRRFFDWMNLLRAEDVDGHRFPETQHWVVGKQLAVETAIDRDRTRARKADRHRRRMLRKNDRRDVQHGKSWLDSTVKRIERSERRAAVGNVHDHRNVNVQPKAKSGDWTPKGEHSGDRQLRTAIENIRHPGRRSAVSGMLRRMDGMLDPADIDHIGRALVRFAEPGGRTFIGNELYHELRQAAHDGRLTDMREQLRPVFVRAMQGTGVDEQRLHRAFDAYVAAGTPGLSRVLRMAGVPVPPPERPHIHETRGTGPVPEVVDVPRRSRNRYHDHVARALEGRMETDHRDHVARALHRLTDTTRPAVIREGTRWLLADAIEHGREQEAIGILRNVFSRVMYEGDPNQASLDFLRYDGAFDAYLAAGAPGLLRVLRISGIPAGNAKNFLRLFRRSPDTTAPVTTVGTVEPREFPGYETMADKLFGTPPPQEAFDRLNRLQRMMRQRGNTMPAYYRQQVARDVAGMWVDQAMPHLTDQPDARLALINRLEEEGFPGLPRMTVQSIQSYLSEHGQSDLPPRFVRRMLRRREQHRRVEEQLAAAPYRLPRAEPIPFRRPRVDDPSPEELERRRLQSENQRLENMIDRHRKKRRRQQAREKRRQIVQAIDERLAREHAMHDMTLAATERKPRAPESEQERERRIREAGNRNRKLRQNQEEQRVKRKLEKFERLPAPIRVIARTRLDTNVLHAVEEKERAKQKLIEAAKEKVEQKRRAARARRLRTMHQHFSGIKHVLGYLAGSEDNKEARKYLFYRNKRGYELPKDLQDT